MGTPTQKKFTHFLLWGMIEMQRLQYTQSRNLNGMKSRKNTKIVYTCEQLESFFSNLIPKNTSSHLHFGMESLLQEGFEPSLKIYV